MNREFWDCGKVRRVVCLVFGICAAALLTGSCVERGIERVEAKMERTQKTLTVTARRIRLSR